jgi:hypothetical protein
MAAPKHIIAQIITLYGTQVGLLVAEPNWETEVSVSLELPIDIAKEPITFNESRRAFAQSARYTMKWRAYLPTAKDATELRIFLTRIRGESILVPLWPDACELQNNVSIGQTTFTLVDTPVRYGAAWIIANDDFSSWEIVNVTSLNTTTRVIHLAIGVTKTWAAGTTMFPLIGGRLADRPKPESISDETCEVDLSLKENTDFSFRLSTPAGALPSVGSHIQAFRFTPLFDVPPNYVRPIDWTEQPDIIYQEIGFLRTEQQRAYDHRNARGVELEYYENARADIARVERFWRTQRGPVLRFMIPTWRGDMRMSGNTPTPSHPTWILCEGSEFSNPGREAQPGDPYIALIGPTGVIDPYQLSAAIQLTNGGTRLVATQNVSAHTATSTIVSHLFLARFSEAKLEWVYTTPYLATTKIKFVELPHEYANPPAALPEPAYLFIFTEVGVRTDRFTSYENTIQISTGTYAGTYVPAPFSFDTLKTGLKLDQEQLSLKSFKFLGNPLNKMWPFSLDGLLKLEVVEIDAVHPNVAGVSRFYGDIWSVDADYNATAIAFGNLFDRKFPRFLLSVTDNYTQFSAPTKLNANSFKITGTFVTPNHASQTVVVTSAAGFVKPADYFAGGWLETGANNTLEKRGILHSEPTAPNKVTLHIDRPLLKAVNAAAVSLFPGYDGSIDECETKFSNRINFGGHPYIPNVNPAVKAMQPKNVQGGKK